MRNSPFWIILITLIVLVDFYVFYALKSVLSGLQPRTRMIIYSVYWSLSILSIILIFVLPAISLEHPKGIKNVIFAGIMALFFAKLVASLFFLIDDIRRVIQWLSTKVFTKTEAAEINDGERISRSLFLSWLGLAAGGTLFGSLIYGLSNKYNYQVKRVALKFSKLPSSFKGLKVVHISDIHSGSFTNKDAVQFGVERIMQLQPDLILFTGDMVNNLAVEMNEYVNIFSMLKAPMGVYSILGNHDYGDYHKWESPEEKVKNLQQLKDVHRDMGWRLLLDENILLERNNEQIALLGIQNWSNKARFPKYGNLEKAYDGIAHVPFKILMSHDPSHWDAEVRTKYTDIDLTLSGHTHGMQFGVEIPWLKWSPVQYVYKQWAGLYTEGAQKLYVNRGFGFLGYPGRVGILPEITLLEFA